VRKYAPEIIACEAITVAMALLGGDDRLEFISLVAVPTRREAFVVRENAALRELSPGSELGPWERVLSE
jgi:hypothetical protein